MRRSGHEGRWWGGPLGQQSFSLFFLFAVERADVLSLEVFLTLSSKLSLNSVASIPPLSESLDGELSNSSSAPKSVDLKIQVSIKYNSLH